jgi:hypothetical protein
MKISKEENEFRIKERWESLKPFENDFDVPLLPKPLTSYHVTKLVKAGAILKKDLIDGKRYYGNCRNTDNATWNKDKNVFTYVRYKFGSRFSEDLNHFEDDNGYDLFVPIKEID